MRIGIMGGTLDPVHCGHLQIAEAVRKFLMLDRIMLLPAGDPPHKSRVALKKDRLNMARKAAGGNVFACGIEVFRSGTTYTVDTLKWLSENNPSTQWFYIIGADTLRLLDSWKDLKIVSSLCTFAVVGRSNEAPDEACAVRLLEKYGSKFVFVPYSGPEISSTEIRTKVAKGEDIHDLVPCGVAEYIHKNGLYLCGMQKSEIIAELERDLKPSRIRHTLGVVEIAVYLAKKHGVDPAKAEIAALLHDCAKYMSVPEMQRLIRENISDSDEAEINTQSLLHAPAGSVLAKEKYGVLDAEILSAIRKHTIGDVHMSPMDALIYTADFIEPNREPFEGLEEARLLAESDIFAAMRKCAELTNAYLASQGKAPHPKSIKMIEIYRR